MVRALAIFCLAATLVQGARILTMSPGTDAAMPDASKGKGKGKAAQPPPLAGKGKGKPPPPASAAKPKGPPVRIKTAGGGLDLANFKGLRRTNNLEQLEARATEQGVNKAPIDIKDAVFVNPSTSTPAVESIPELFAKWPQTKLLLVDFFAFSCTNCIRAGRTIGDIYERYHDHGLRVLAFARPEFTFEGDTREVLSWARRNNIKYSVATDAMGTNWRSWKVDSWPTHFLVQEDPRQEHKGEYVISYMHVGDRNSHELYNKVIQLLKLPDAPVPGINTVGYTDVEVFLGLGFRHKNIGEEECSETKACRGPALGPMADASNVQELPRPKDGDFTVYGTEFCIWCRRTKTLLELSGASFTYIDVQDFGGKVIVYDKLGLPRKGHETMPAVYGLDGNLLGGFAEVKTFFPEVDVQDVIDATPEVKVSAATVYQKAGSEALVQLKDPGQWKAGREGIVAQVDGAEILLQAQLKEASQTSLYVVCKPANSVGYVTRFTVGGTPLRTSILHAGRHYVASYPGNKMQDTLQVDKGMELYVFWLSAEPSDHSLSGV